MRANVDPFDGVERTHVEQPLELSSAIVLVVQIREAGQFKSDLTVLKMESLIA